MKLPMWFKGVLGAAVLILLVAIVVVGITGLLTGNPGLRPY